LQKNCRRPLGALRCSALAFLWWGFFVGLLFGFCCLFNGFVFYLCLLSEPLAFGGVFMACQTLFLFPDGVAVYGGFYCFFVLCGGKNSLPDAVFGGILGGVLACLVVYHCFSCVACFAVLGVLRSPLAFSNPPGVAVCAPWSVAPPEWAQNLNCVLIFKLQKHKLLIKTLVLRCFFIKKCQQKAFTLIAQLPFADNNHS
jgi:hypothetical protein